MSLTDIAVEVIKAELLRHLDLPSALSFTFTCRAFAAALSDYDVIVAVKRAPTIDTPSAHLLITCLEKKYVDLARFFLSLCHRALRSLRPSSFVDVLSAALRGGFLDFYDEMIRKTGFLPNLEWEGGENYFSFNYLEAIAGSGDVASIERFLEMEHAPPVADFPPYVFLAFYKGAARRGCVNVLEWTEKFPKASVWVEKLMEKEDSVDFLDLAAEFGGLETVQWFSKKFSTSPKVNSWHQHCQRFATRNHREGLAIIRHCMSICKAADQDLPRIAARECNLDVFAWAAKFFRFFDRRGVLVEVIKSGDVKFLEYYLASFPPKDIPDKKDLIRSATESLNADMLEFVVRKWVPVASEITPLTMHELVAGYEGKALTTLKAYYHKFTSFGFSINFSLPDNSLFPPLILLDAANSQFGIPKNLLVLDDLNFLESVGFHELNPHPRRAFMSVDAFSKYYDAMFTKFLPFEDVALLKSCSVQVLRYLAELNPAKLEKAILPILTEYLVHNRLSALDFIASRFPHLIREETFGSVFSGKEKLMHRGAQWLVQHGISTPKLYLLTLNSRFPRDYFATLVSLEVPVPIKFLDTLKACNLYDATKFEAIAQAIGGEFPVRYLMKT